MSFIIFFQVFFINFPTGLLCGEIRKAWVEFVNVSAVPLTGLRVVSTHPEFFTFGSATSDLTPVTPTAAEHCSAYKTIVTPPSVAAVTLVSPASFGVTGEDRLKVAEIHLTGGVLGPGEALQIPLWLRGPDREGVHEIHFLFYYESVEKNAKLRYPPAVEAFNHIIVIIIIFLIILICLLKMTEFTASNDHSSLLSRPRSQSPGAAPHSRHLRESFPERESDGVSQ